MIQAAVEIGLEDLSVSAIALRLGVSVAVIYTYVEGLDQLRRLVAVALARRPAIQDEGQHWADIARAHTDNVHMVLSSEPALLAQMVLGAVGPDEQMEELETFLGLLTARGFDPDAALDLYRGCGQIALGAATMSAMTVARTRRGIDAQRELQSLLADERDDGHPCARRLGAARIGDGKGGDYRPVLELFLASIAARRGETLPPAASAI